MGKLVVTFYCDEVADRSPLERFTNTTMDIDSTEMSTADLLYAGLMLHRYVIEYFSKIAIEEEGHTQESADRMVKGLSEFVNKLAPSSIGEAR